MGKEIFPHYRPPAEYTGELFGVEYLYSQIGATLPSDANIDSACDNADLDEGFQDDDQLEEVHKCNNIVSFELYIILH